MSHFWQILNIFDQSFGWKWPSGAIVERKNWNFPIRTVLCQWSFSKFFKKLVLAEFFKYELLEKLSEPSRAFWPKARAKTEQNRAEPRLGSNTSTSPNYWQMFKSFKITLFRPLWTGWNKKNCFRNYNFWNTIQV